jgi:NADH-quinone oxidoreductase subunit A
VIFNYGNVLVFAIAATLFVTVTMLVSRLLQPSVYDTEKLTSYECGMRPVGSAWVQFSIRFYLVALAFIVFDVEILFLFPWSVVFTAAGIAALVKMGIFIAILLLGLAYAWQRSDLDWVKQVMSPEEGSF